MSLPTAQITAPEDAAARSLAVQRVRFTPEMLHQLRELGVLDAQTRYELIEGDIYPTTPEGPEHAALGTALAYRLMERRSTDWHVRIEKPLRLGDSEVIPDLAVVPGRPSDYRTHHPETALLIVEIAHSSLPRDRLLKLPLYARAGVPEYWIVNLAERQVEVYRTPAGDSYQSVQVYTAEATLAPRFAPDWTLPVHDLLDGA
ncbi:MAG: Uma2 family endonuclease [Armatimonadetes bacterium]|nr:Uma2 family endonuclease [Armatimonadota bacterium]